MANVFYNEAKKQIANGGIDLLTDTLKVVLVDATYVANADQAAVDDGTADDIASHEITVSGYARQTLGSKVIDKDTANDFAYLDAADAVFAALALGQTIGGAVLIKDTGLDTTSIPINYYETPDTPTNGADMTVQWASVANGGVLKLS